MICESADRCSFRKATEEEIAEALRVKERINILLHYQEELEELYKECDHKVWEDTLEYGYTARTCVKCGYQTVL